MKHVVMYSGGIGSWAAAMRVVEKHGTEGVELLFADTLIEDEDLYRFAGESADKMGVPLVTIRDGRTPFEVYRDERFLGNSRVAPCSKILKQRVADTWLESNCDPAQTVVYVGIDWTESHRLERLRARRKGWDYQAPMCEAPYVSKRYMLEWCRECGIEPPRLYAMGFAHNNCGGFCCRAGQGAFANLYRHFPIRYRRWEAEEEKLRAELGDVSMMTDRSGDGKKKPLTMRALRDRIEARAQIDMLEVGGCGCFVDEEATT